MSLNLIAASVGTASLASSSERDVAIGTALVGAAMRWTLRDLKRG